MTSQTIWIDLDNTPHVPFFVPIVDELHARGYTTVVTARDAYQTCEVADLFHLAYTRVGRHYGKRMFLKVGGTVYRAAQLAWLIRGRGAGLAVSHGSRSQMLAARLIGMPSLALYDYEFVGRSLLAPTWVMAPSVMPTARLHAPPNRVLGYAGIKEDVYVPTFKPDPTLRQRIGLTGEDVVVLLRPPATEAHYHNHRSESLFAATLQFLAASAAEVKVVIVPRNARQAANVRERWRPLLASGRFLLLDRAEDGLNLIWNADLVISGGGTMNREAAAMRVPVYSIFRGEIGAVDRYLADQGRLILLEGPEELALKVVLRRRVEVSTQPEATETLTQVVDHIEAIVAHESGVHD